MVDIKEVETNRTYHFEIIFYILSMTCWLAKATQVGAGVGGGDAI